MKIYQLAFFMLLSNSFSCSNARNLSSLTESGSIRRYSEDQFSSVTRKIYYGGITNPLANLPKDAERGVLIFRDDEESKDIKNARVLAKALRQKFEIPEAVIIGNQRSKDILRFYREQFGRNSYDNVGSSINLSVDVNRNFPIDPIFRHNAMWLSDQEYLAFGAGGNNLNSFIKGTDVVGHEFTHAVISKTSNLDYQGESGALNEHFADLMGEMFQWYLTGEDSRFLIGEELVSDPSEAMRNMLNPELSKPTQPSHIREIPFELGINCVPTSANDACGVHKLSGIPNKASAKIIAKLGWIKTRDIFYNTMTLRLNSVSKFSDWAREIRAECTQSLTGNECQIVDAALVEVGL